MYPALFAPDIQDPDKFNILEHRARVSNTPAKASPAKNVSIQRPFITISQGVKLPFVVYRPKEKEKAFYHTAFYIPGTAFIAQEFAYTDVICSNLCEQSGCQIIALYHRLAPETQFPSPGQDIHQAFEMMTHFRFTQKFKIDLNNIALVGYSSGATLAIQTAIYATLDNIAPIKRLIAISPIADFSRQLRDYRQFEQEDSAISEEFVRLFMSLYIPRHVNLMHPELSPIHHTSETLRQLPPIDLVFGENDRFRSDAEALASKLAGIKVQVTRFMINAQNHSLLWRCPEVVQLIARRLSESFDAQPQMRPSPLQKFSIMPQPAMAMGRAAANEDSIESTTTLLRSKL